MGDPKREEVEQLWRSRLKDAQLRLDFARHYLTEVQRDLPSAENSPEVFAAFERAIGQQDAAFEEYHRVLRIFTDLVNDGKIPDEKEWLRRKAASAG